MFDLKEIETFINDEQYGFSKEQKDALKNIITDIVIRAKSNGWKDGYTEGYNRALDKTKPCHVYYAEDQRYNIKK